MTIANLIRRLVVNRPLTAADHDANLDAIETAVDAKAATSSLATVATSGAYGDLTGRPTLGTAAALDVAATGDASATQVVKGSDSTLSNAREWSAATVTQAQAEAGTSTSRLAFTPQRVFQAAAAWWQANSGATGRAVATAATQADGRTALGLGSAATAAITDFATAAQGTDARTPTDGSVTDAKIVPAGLSASSINWAAIAPWQASTAYGKSELVSYLGVAYRRSVAGTSGATFNATNWQQITPSDPPAHNQVWSTITGTPTTVAGYGITDALSSASLASPPAIGGTTPAAGTFTALAATASMLLPAAAPSAPAAGHVYRSGNLLAYRDSTAAEQILLYGAGNLANLTNKATARSNLDLTPAGGLSIQSGSLVPVDYIKIVLTNTGETGTTGSNKAEVTINRAFTIIGAYWECAPTATGSTSSQAMPYLRPRSTGVKASLLTGNATLAAAASFIDVSANLTGTLTGAANDSIGVDLVAVGTGSSGHILTILVRYS